MAWSTPIVHPGLISVAPGLASHGGLLHMVHKGAGDNTNTFHSTWQPGGGWSEVVQNAGPHGTGRSPALASHMGTLHKVHRGKDTARLWHSSWKGTLGQWTEPQQIPDHSSRFAVALTSHDGVLHMVHKGRTTDKIWHSTWSHQGGWSQTHEVEGQLASGINTGSSLALASLEGTLHLVYRDPNGPKLWHTIWSGSALGDWSSRQEIGGHVAEHAAAVAAHNGRLHLVYRRDKTTELHHAVWHPEGQVWSSSQTIDGQETRRTPALASHDHRLHLVYKGKDNDTPRHSSLGKWTVVLEDAEILAVHAALVGADSIVYFGGNEHFSDQAWRFEDFQNGAPPAVDKFDNTRIFAIETNTVLEVKGLETDAFCCEHAFLPAGELLVAGGTELWRLPGDADDDHQHGAVGHWTGERRCWIFRAGEQAWEETGSMLANPGQREPDSGGRWYPTLVTLSDGRVLALAGHPSISDSRHVNDTAETFADGKWAYVLDKRRNVATVKPDYPYYPRVHLLPSGLVFLASPIGGQQRVFDPQAGGFVGPPIAPPPSPRDWTERTHTTVLLPLLPEGGYVPRVLLVGPRQPYRIDLGVFNFPDSLAGAEAPLWQPTDTRVWSVFGPDYGCVPVRRHACAVLLPTGEVLVTGGIQGGTVEGQAGEPDATAVLAGEIYRPGIDWTDGFGSYPPPSQWADREEWATVEQATVVRNYHSVALLMPDGRVWTAGSNKNGSSGNPADVAEKRLEVYDHYAGLAGRPTILQAPQSITYDQELVVRVALASNDVAVERVALIRCGSVTHAFDNDQRYVGLVFETSQTGSEVEVHVLLAGVAPGVAPPGNYLLWVIDTAGRPCLEAAFLQLS